MRHYGTKWPKGYQVCLFLTEKDHGGFSSLLNSIWIRVKDRVNKAVRDAVTGALTGYLGSVIARVIAEAVVWVINVFAEWLINLFGDDTFPPQTLKCTVPSYYARWTLNGQWGSTTSGLRRAYFSGHGGQYFVEYYWKLFS